ncbi:hypothetical protein [Lacticaseibacillus manihotivorans]|uniref:hypothetical protein n=1 Tax=Lacticaseibacillus manihotivorans TaxID=88233 RepID=UPI0006D27B1D|nr:hypothetical protein [Lacticaseibacillus manihotivorans]
MKIAKLISGIIALLAGFSPLLLSLIGLIAVLGMGVGSVITELIGLLTAVGMFASGILQIVAHKTFYPKLELWAIADACTFCHSGDLSESLDRSMGASWCTIVVRCHHLWGGIQR